MSRSDLFHFARSCATGRIVDVSEVARGRACNCVCPGCNSPVLARKGTQRRHGFAHDHATSCASAGESGLHQAAKQILAEASEIALPPVGREASRSFVVASSSIPDTGGWPIGARRPDVVWRSWRDEVLHVEVTVRHGMDDDKRADIASSGVATLEYDLSFLPVAFDEGLDALRRLLLTDRALARWVFHPDQRHAHSKTAVPIAQPASVVVPDELPAAATAPAERPRSVDEPRLVDRGTPSVKAKGRVLGQFRFPSTWAFIYDQPGEPEVCNIRWVPFALHGSLSELNWELTQRAEASGLICYYLHRVTERQLIGQNARNLVRDLLKALGGIEVGGPVVSPDRRSCARRASSAQNLTSIRDYHVFTF